MSGAEQSGLWNFQPIGEQAAIRFNDYARYRLSSIISREPFYTNDSIAELTINYGAKRVVQLPGAPTWPETPRPVFAEAFKYAAYICTIKMISNTEEIDTSLEPNAPLLGILPPLPSDKSEREIELEKTGRRTRKLCLFNPVVALEWQPNLAYLRQLVWAFRRASDFLYDATDGYMALGQVLFGDWTFMRSADIQIFASSRLFPRSWVSGMYDKAKHAPIRVGRGLWRKNNKSIIPWDEPDAYRILVHELAHYALGLKDGYLERRTTIPATTPDRPGPHAPRLIDSENLPRDKGAQADTDIKAERQQGISWCQLAVPTIGLAVESIMANLDGSSEFTPRLEQNQKGTTEWEDLCNGFPLLEIPEIRVVDPGPGRLPLPLPEFGFIRPVASIQDDKRNIRSSTALSEQAYQITRPWHVRKSSVSSAENPPGAANVSLSKTTASVERRLIVPTRDRVQIGELYIDPDHCWIYLLRDSIDNSTALIAQGSLPARAKDEGYMLLGPTEDDINNYIVVLVGSGSVKTSAESEDSEDEDPEPAPLVQYAHLSDLEEDGRLKCSWSDATPAHFPLVDVLPDEKTTTQPQYMISVQINIQLQLDNPSWQARIFPLDEKRVDSLIRWETSQAEPPSTRSEIIKDLNSLDGHVVLITPNGGKEGKLGLTIAAYSIGGSPSSAYPPMPNPISAGSSEGNVMLFFYDERVVEDPKVDVGFGNHVVVTTLNHGIKEPNGFSPRSYTFSLATNKPLPKDLAPTLIMFYDKATARDANDLFICRYDENKQWTPISTYLNAGSSYTAAPLGGAEAPSPLAHDTAPGLFDEGGSRVERYRLCLVGSSNSGNIQT